MILIEALEDKHADDVLTICKNLRAQDKTEIFATRFDDQPEDLAFTTMRLTGSSWIVYRGLDPVAVLGITPIMPGGWGAWAFGTNAFPKVAISLTRFIKKGIIPSLLASGAKHVQALVWTEYHQARKWLRGFGAKEEAVIPSLGKGGEDFALTVWRP